MSNNKISFISNNVKGIQALNYSEFRFRIKLFEYLRKYVMPNGFIFLQETHATNNDEKKWCDEFKGKIFFSHGKSNSCCYRCLWLQKLELLNKVSDK